MSGLYGACNQWADRSICRREVQFLHRDFHVRGTVFSDGSGAVFRDLCGIFQRDVYWFLSECGAIVRKGLTDGGRQQIIKGEEVRSYRLNDYE